MSIFKRKDTAVEDNWTTDEEFCQILSKMTVDQEVEIREIAFRNWVLINARVSDRYELTEKCSVYLTGYLNGLADCEVISREEVAKIKSYIMTRRFKDLACDRLVSLRRKEADDDDESGEG